VTLAATVTVALWVAVVTVGFNLVLAHRLAAQADDVLRVRSEAVASTLVISPSGQVTLRDAGGDTAIDMGAWIFQGHRLVEGPTVRTAIGAQAQKLAAGGTRFSVTDQPFPVRLYAQPVLQHGTKVATIVTSVELTAYAQTRRAALVGSALVALLLLAGVFLVLRSAVSRALSPVEAMTRQAAAWSIGDSPGRFGDEVRPAELAVLGGTLDTLLTRLAAMLRHEKQLAGELSHELRTPLSRIIAESDLLTERPQSPEELAAGHASILQSAEQMRDILETLLATARTDTGAPAGRCDAFEVARSVATRRTIPHKTVVVTRSSGDTRAGVDSAVLERALVPILDNALRYAVKEVRIEVYSDPDSVRIDIADDGPGIPEASLPHVFEPGRRADPADGHPGAGLGLALARRLLVASGGGISASSTPPGATFHLTLPHG